MKLALKIIGLITLFAAIGWFNFAMKEPQNIAEAEVPLTALSQNETSMQTVTDFTDISDEAERWRGVDDTVMGGVSEGEFYVTQQDTGVFRGTLSLENNGGFSSARRASGDYDFSNASELSLRVKGDGRRYQVRVQTADAEDISYRATFATAGEWQVVDVSFSEFEPVFRGRIVSDAPPLNAAAIEQIGFLIADKKEGEFKLEVDWIRAE